MMLDGMELCVMWYQFLYVAKVAGPGITVATTLHHADLWPARQCGHLHHTATIVRRLRLAVTMAIVMCNQRNIQSSSV